ncbi:MAG: HAD hydrolase-like protein [Thermoanaerobaculaceae bacterium]
MQILVLFDIDGTLISTGGKAFAALAQAFLQVVGEEAPVNGFSPAGKTDPQIFRELLERAAVPAGEKLLPQLQATYLKVLPKYLRREHVRKLPGVDALLASLAQDPRVALGLLTGNLLPGARHKLELAGLWHFFPVGAFGSDHPDRNQLLPFAVQRAETHFQQAFPFPQVVVVGDTPADVRCAHVWGAKAIAVAGHTTSSAALARANADAVVPSLVPELFFPVLEALCPPIFGS